LIIRPAAYTGIGALADPLRQTRAVHLDRAPFPQPIGDVTGARPTSIAR
jgi:hypothetical protein